MHLTLTLSLLAISIWKRTWMHWKKYALTVHYVIIANLLYNFLCHGHLLWEYKGDIFPDIHIVVDLVYTFINLPAITLLYLAFYPFSKTFIRQARYIIIFVIVSMLIEYSFIYFDRLVLDHGYKYWMDFFFYIVMYSMIRLHHSRPLLTYGLSIIITVFLMVTFKVPLK